MTTISITTKSEKYFLNKILLISGIVSSLLYILINIVVAMQYEGYNAASQTVSELSAIDTPTRSLWVFLLTIYSAFVLAFGIGVWRFAEHNRYLRIAGILIIIYIVVGLFWPPMHQREALAAGMKSMTDTLHIVFTAITVPIMLSIIGFGAAAFGRKFRLYSIATIVVQIAFGILTGLGSPQLEANLPTPLIGVWERISIGSYMIWVIVFAIALLRMKQEIATSVNH